MYSKKCNKDDLLYILSNLRESDREELEELYGDDWLDKQMESFQNIEECNIGYLDNGKPVFVYGCSSVNDIGIVGMLSTSDIEETKLKFLKGARAWIKSLLKKHKLLINSVYSRNIIAIKWLKWLGFTVEKHYGLGDRFLLFYKKR